MKIGFRESLYLLSGGLIVGMLPLLLFPNSVVMLALGIVCVLAGVIQTFFFFRCPHCGACWNIRGGIPTYCPHCGEKVE